MFSCPIDKVCGEVLNMAMCLIVCLIVLQVEVVRDQFCITSCCLVNVKLTSV